MRLTFAETTTIEKIKSYLDSNYHQRIKIADLVKSYPISETKLYKGFVLLYEVSVYRYHLTKVMEYALHEIKNGTQIKEIAWRLGYSDSGSFTRAFRSIYEQSPAELKYTMVVCYILTFFVAY